MLFAEEPNIPLEITKIGGTLVAAFVGAYLAGWFQRRKAREDRRQARREEAYRAAAEAVIKARNFVRKLERQPEELLPYNDLEWNYPASSALVALFGSEEVRELFAQLADAEIAFGIADAAARAEGPPTMETIHKVEQYNERSEQLRVTRSRCMSLCDDLIGRMQSELENAPVGRPWVPEEGAPTDL